MTLAEKQQALIDDLSIIENHHERLTVIVDRARRAPPLASAEKTDAHRVPACVSAVWLVGELRDDRLYLRFDAESPLVKGLVGLLCEFYHSAPCADILATEPTFLETLNFLRDLSPTRRNGLTAVRTRIRDLASHPDE